MRERRLGKTGYQVEEVASGAWAIGAGWGDVAEEIALDTPGTVLGEGQIAAAPFLALSAACMQGGRGALDRRARVSGHVCR
mgnify:CR=1 FL=1